MNIQQRRWFHHGTLFRSPDLLCGTLVLSIALALRIYRLSADPLWLDEIYAYQLGQLGLRAMIANSLVDPHPPLYYLLQWSVGGFGTLHAAWGWRWLAMISGTMVVGLVYLLARQQQLSIWAVGLGCGLLALNPLQVYFSQEARSSAIVVLLTGIATVLMWRIVESPVAHRRWLWFGLISILGLYISYDLMIVSGVQLLYLLFVVKPRRPVLLACAVITLTSLPLLWFAAASLHGVVRTHSTTTPVTLVQVMQALSGGELARYGVFWTHRWLAGVATIFVLMGLWFGWRSGSRRAMWYYGLQIGLPLLLFFGIAVPVLHINLPINEAKHFIVLVPAGFVLIIRGIEGVGQMLGRRSATVHWLGALVCLVVFRVKLYASMINLQHYWTTSKSPEGFAVLDLRQQLQPDDVIVSQHYSLSAAVSFYLPDAPTFARPRITADGYRFTRSLIITLGYSAPPSDVPLTTIVASYPRIWLLSLASRDGDLLTAFEQHCSMAGEQMHGPFRTTLLQDCRP